MALHVGLIAIVAQPLLATLGHLGRCEALEQPGGGVVDDEEGAYVPVCIPEGGGRAAGPLDERWGGRAGGAGRASIGAALWRS